MQQTFFTSQTQTNSLHIGPKVPQARTLLTRCRHSWNSPCDFGFQASLALFQLCDVLVSVHAKFGELMNTSHPLQFTFLNLGDTAIDIICLAYFRTDVS